MDAISKLEAQSKLVLSLTSGDTLDRANFGIAIFGVATKSIVAC